ncbi:uncharacterized protein F5147DRAFT_656209 [Suillus discolor]|uniref:G domain-containing protein n=1 Tax=Suillus discolor TaxID=1912936 RepID=A0A9P7F078_9AGAM|nr:uncharacterized protein F5147DRAFT_656209 [Suillus discolor]KAG2097971.1 hypothetical protein F5147DRAFT_656209 [Suillus discolor]
MYFKFSIVDLAWHSPNSVEETCNIGIFGETGAGKSSLVNLVAGTPTGLTSCDATGCITESNVHDVLIQNETLKLKVKLFDTVGLGEGPEGTVPDKDAARILKKLLRDFMKQTDIHLMYSVRGVRVTKGMLKWCRTQSYYAVLQLIEQCRLSQRVQTPLFDVGRCGKTPRAHILLMSISRKKHKDIVLAEETAPSAGSLVHHPVAEEIASTTPDLRLCTLQYTAIVDLHDEIFKAFETIWLKDSHLEIKEHSIPPENGCKETDASVGSHISLMAGDEVAPTAPDMQRRIPTHIGIMEYPITSDIDNDSRANLVVGGGVAPTAPNIECCMLQCSEIVASDDETSEACGTMMVLFWQTGANKSSLVNILAREKVVHPAPDMRRYLLQCIEAVKLGDKTSVENFDSSTCVRPS